MRPFFPFAGVEPQDETHLEEFGDNAGKSSGLDRDSSAPDFSSMGADDYKEFKSRIKGKKRSLRKKTGGTDLYALLGLQHERWMASDSQIRSAYRRVALEHHPDKQRASTAGDEKAMAAAEERFKAIQEAYETLMDPAKRREYDSLDAFDDSLPGMTEAATDFYGSFGSAFRRNARWSVNQPVPDLGNDSTDMGTVDSFYDFWFSFKSWREFPHPDEEDIEAAESREERRWIERYNAKLREKGKKEEIRRIREFVNLASQLDPRLISRREQQRAEKERARIKRELEKARIAEEEKKKAEAAEREKEEAALAAAEAKKRRQAEKKALQRERARLRKLCGLKSSDNDGHSGVGSNEKQNFWLLGEIKGDGASLNGEASNAAQSTITAEDVELLCLRLDQSSLIDLCDALEKPRVPREAKLKALGDQVASVQRKMEEEENLRKEAVQDVASITAKASQKEEADRIARLSEWNEEEIRMLKKAIDKFPPGTSRRWEQVQLYMRTRTVPEILDMVKYGLMTGKYTSSASDRLQIAKKREENTIIQSAATQRTESYSDVNVNLRGQAAQTFEAAAGGLAENETSSKETKSWTQEEELALVKALKDIPKDAQDRWDQVAKAVGTKSKVACAKRFKEMKESYKAKKTANT